VGAASLLIAWAAGWLWVRAAGFARGSVPLEILFSLPLGLGGTAALFFVLLCAGTGPLSAALAADALMLLCGAAAWYWRRSAPVEANDATLPGFRWNWAAVLALSLALLLFCGAMWTATASNPQGLWDAWAMWNLRAKFLAGSGTWHYAVSAQASQAHNEYPPLWPSVIARAWAYSGGAFEADVPIATGVLFALSVPLLLAFSLARMRGIAIGCMASLTLLTALPFWQQAPAQSADVPLALLMLASLAAAAMAGEKAWNPGALAIGGALASVAACTKHEGILFLVVSSATVIGVARLRAWPWLAGAAPVGLLAAIYKLAMAPANRAFDPAGLADFGRLAAVLRGFAFMLWNQGDIPALPLLLAALAAFALGLRAAPRPWWVLAPPLLLLAGDAVALWGTAFDLAWHIASSLDRLLVQTIPSLLFGLFILLNSPASPPEPAAPADRSSPRSRRRQQR
jgi:hypothetical protein